MVVRMSALAAVALIASTARTSDTVDLYLRDCILGVVYGFCFLHGKGPRKGIAAQQRGCGNHMEERGRWG